MSAHRGRSAYLLKSSSKHKRKRSEIEEVKEEERMLKVNKQGFLQEIKRLKKENTQLGSQVSELNHN